MYLTTAKHSKLKGELRRSADNEFGKARLYPPAPADIEQHQEHTRTQDREVHKQENAKRASLVAATPQPEEPAASARTEREHNHQTLEGPSSDNIAFVHDEELSEPPQDGTGRGSTRRKKRGR